MKFIFVCCISCLLSFAVAAKDYNASFFGVKSDGRTMNTNSIQKGIDFISANGGGTLVFYTGRYLTGGIRLKSNVSIRIEEGAVLVGSTSPYDYNSSSGIRAIISAVDQENISISGHGAIEGNGVVLSGIMEQLNSKGFLLDSLAKKPALLGFINCTGINISLLNLWDAAGSVQVFLNCSNITISGISIRSTQSNEAANIFRDSKKVRFSNSYVEATAPSLEWIGAAGEIIIEKSIDENGTVIKLQ